MNSKTDEISYGKCCRDKFWKFCKISIRNWREKEKLFQSTALFGDFLNTMVKTRKLKLGRKVQVIDANFPNFSLFSTTFR